MDILNRYRENHNSSSSDDDSENSDDECAVWKRAKNKTINHEPLPNNGISEETLAPTENNKEETMEPPQQLPEEPKPGQKRKRNTIWCDVLQDQLIAEDLEDCLLKNKPRHYGSRGKESYDYTQAYTDERRESESDMSGCSMNDDFDTNPKSKKKGSFPSHRKNKKFVKLSVPELEAARKINKVLNEKKQYLIRRIVKYTGIEKAMNYLEQTKEIEDNGGMMIKSRSRRRTPGGVYIQLVKDDKDITQETLDKIFEGEMSGYEMKKFFEERRKKKKKKNFKRSSKEFSKKEVEISEPMEPDETALMDAEVTNEVKLAEPNSEVILSTVPVPDYKSPEDDGALEEGEIEE